MEIFALLGFSLGGLGLFLLAIDMMTDGLKLAAGPALRRILSEWSRTPLRGIFSGFLMTAIVQSSSAITVASLGFVNAGLINMRQALGIIYGANVGTTITGWLVALVGFKIDVQAFALPMIGLGMAMRLVKRYGKIGSFGMALVGFGLFFVGVEFLRDSFVGLVEIFDLARFTAEGLSGIFIFLLVGVIMTILTQSSSASIALTITAASSGMVGIYAAGAMVIGANIGTTSTAAVASIGATSSAKRVAAAQVIFNVVTALVALALLPVLFYLIEELSLILDFNVNPAISLALFHTIFNVLGVLLIYPHTSRMVFFLEKRFKSREEKESRPRFLDDNIAKTPVLAVNALFLEMQGISEKVALLFYGAIKNKSLGQDEFYYRAKIIKLLSYEVSKFIVTIENSEISEETTHNLTTLMRVDQYFVDCAVSAEKIYFQLRERQSLNFVSLDESVTAYFDMVLSFIEMSRRDEFEGSSYFQEKLLELKDKHDRLKSNLILEATRSNIEVKSMSETIDCLAEALRAAQQWYKALRRLYILREELNLSGEDILGLGYKENTAH